ncbi:MAG: hypothetical protein H8D82_00540 [Euryarchaeota archaeon]|nr:hypothetical protein [Euryarchaeota archaeon]
MMGWNAVLVWFSANILSQAAFIGMHGIPYDGTLFISALGPWSWVLVVAEIGIWVTLASLLGKKFFGFRKSHPSHI